MTQGYHQSRFGPDSRRDVLWRVLWRDFFRHRVPENACVLDLGSGYGQFINSVVARRRIAIDSWPGFKDHLAPGVQAIVGEVTDLSMIGDAEVDYAFASNLFEHLTQAQLAQVLAELKRTLSPTGTLTILQPNYRYAFREYFDDFTHVAVWSHVSLVDFLLANGFEIVDLRPKFLPLTIKSRLPVWPLLISVYLALPIKPLAKQMLVVARLRPSAFGEHEARQVERA